MKDLVADGSIENFDLPVDVWVDVHPMNSVRSLDNIIFAESSVLFDSIIHNLFVVSTEVHFALCRQLG